jgi:lipopolysaccharide transport system ATP-binding protein
MTVIRVEHLSKQYRLGMIGGGTLREDLSRWWAMKRGKADPLARVGDDGHKPRMGERFWALKDVSFEVKQGEILGIIGRNGAGKSTLLKILSRITAPTEGVVKIKGRIGSLLEVGTGFHPELTGRENIYLNGAILGMSRNEVTKKLDEIIAFSECEQFIDTPVKRYSSGMYVRLAFAVAAHLDPEILIVDEVLAVGDAAFQKKCLGKMGEVAGEGRTVLFVSHNMAAVRALCGRALLLAGGRMIEDGDPAAVVGRYLSLQMPAGERGDLRDHPGRVPGSTPVFRRIETLSSEGVPSPVVTVPGTMGIRLWLDPPQSVARPAIGLGISTAAGERVFTVHTVYSGSDLPSLECPCVVECWLPDLRLLPGSYTIKAAVGDGVRDFDTIEEAVRFEVSGMSETGRLPSQGTGHQGLVWQQSQWFMKPCEVASAEQLGCGR